MTDHYFGSAINQFENGCQLDLAAKFALDLIKTPYFVDGLAAGEAAVRAFDMAEAMIAEGRKRGCIIALPDDDQLNAPMRRHIRRTARANIVGQIVQNEIAPEEMPKVAGPGAFNGQMPIPPRRS